MSCPSRSIRCRRAFILLAAVRLGAALPAQDQLPGDTDGDGLVTIADAHLVDRGNPVAPGSLDHFAGVPCFDPERTEGSFHTSMRAGAVWLEALRRSVPDPLPHWDPHWTTAEHSILPTVPPSADVFVELLEAPAPGGGDDAVMLRWRVTTFEPVVAFALLVESEGNVLHPPFLRSREEFFAWNQFSWRNLTSVLGDSHATGDVPVRVGFPAFLMTRGRFVVSYYDPNGPLLQPGEYEIRTEARIPKATPSGEYALRLLETSRVMLAAGRVIRPTVAPESALVLDETVTAGWHGQVPSIEVDSGERQVIGAVEFRVADQDGNPARVVAQGEPGESFEVRVQMRTETPLNRIRWYADWPQGSIRCDASVPTENGFSVTNLFRDPDGGNEYIPRLIDDNPESGQRILTCSNGVFVSGNAEGHYALAGGEHFLSQRRIGFVSHVERMIDFFRPLDEWIDVAQLHLLIPEDAAPVSEIPIRIVEPLPPPWDYTDAGEPARHESRVEFLPYQRHYFTIRCADEPIEERGPLWSYDVRSSDSFVRVLGDGEPPPPPDLGIHVSLGSVIGRPGEEVSLPVFCRSAAPLSLVRFVLEHDARALTALAIDVDVVSQLDGSLRTEPVQRGEFRSFDDCVDENGDGRFDHCEPASPSSGWNAVGEFDAETAFVDLRSQSGDYPGASLRKIGELRFRIDDDAVEGEVAIELGSATRVVPGGNFTETVVTGGRAFPSREGIRFSPATEFHAGSVIIVSDEAVEFRRGDGNSDGNVDLSDAVATLNHLFLGALAPACSDAADANDSGALDISDAIFLLGFLFLGGDRLPAPEGCGLDATVDTLGCTAGC